MKSIHHGPHFDLIHDGRDYVASKVVAHGFFDDFLRITYDLFVLPGHTVVEVGAHIGSHTVYLACLTRRGHVYAFEPQKYLWLNLCANLYINDCLNVTPINEGCYSRECVLVATAPSDAPDYALNERKASISFAPTVAAPDGAVNTPAANQYSAPVPASPLDARLGTHTRVDFLKIDVEGADLEVGQGAHDIIHRWQPTIVFEDNAGQFGQWMAMLGPLGYRIVRIAEGNYCAFTDERAAEVEREHGQPGRLDAMKGLAL